MIQSNLGVSIANSSNTGKLNLKYKTLNNLRNFQDQIKRFKRSISCLVAVLCRIELLVIYTQFSTCRERKPKPERMVTFPTPKPNDSPISKPKPNRPKPVKPLNLQFYG